MGSAHAAPGGLGAAVHRFGGPLLRLAGGTVVLVFVARQVGTAPFHDGLRAVTWPPIAACVALTALTTVCAAWRWCVIARALGVDLRLPSAVRAYYRSQFVNSVLPGGVVGDVQRGLAQGRRDGDVGRGLRTVVWDRVSGQVVQAAMAAAVLVILPSPVRPAMPYVMAGVAAVAACGFLVVRSAARRRPWIRRAARAVSDDLLRGPLAPEVWPKITLASVAVVAGHTIMFIIAARVAGCTAPLGELSALLMLVQTVVAIPLNVAGWGPREGVAAWAFAAAGFTAATGVTITTVYAVLALAAVAPGAGLLLRDAVRRRRNVRPGVRGYSRPADHEHRTLATVGGGFDGESRADVTSDSG